MLKVGVFWLVVILVQLLEAHSGCAEGFRGGIGLRGRVERGLLTEGQKKTWLVSHIPVGIDGRV